MSFTESSYSLQHPGGLSLPDDLTSPRAKLIYVFVHIVKETTISELVAELRETKLAILPILNRLVTNGYVGRDGDRLWAKTN